MKKIEHLVTEKRISIAMVIGLLMSLLPIIVLAFYNYPCADDFSASDTAYWVWNSTDSMLEVLEAAWENVVYNYHKWSGVYASVFWTSLQPGLFGEQFYGITTVISVGLFTIAGAYLTYVISKKYIGGSGYSWISICALYLFVSIQCMPNGNEGLYWHAGGANYTWAFAFLLLVLTCVLSIYKEEKTQKKMVQLVLASLCAVLVGGGNYITALQGCIWLVFLDVIFVVVDKKRNVDTYAKALKKNVWVMIPTLILIVAFLISVIAPGNKVRMGMSSGISAIDAILASFQYALILPLEEWLGWQVWILLAVSIPFMWNIVKKQEFSFSYPMVVVLLGYCFIAAGFTPSLYAQGAFQAGRLHDTVYFITIIILHAVSFYLTGWIYHRKRRSFRSKKYKEEKQDLSFRSKCWVAGLLTIWMLGSVFTMKSTTEIYVGTDAIYALVSGQAERYRRENEERLEILKSEEKNVTLPRFTNPPKLLYFNDITNNPGEWINAVVAEYYGKESVKCE